MCNLIVERRMATAAMSTTSAARDDRSDFYTGDKIPQTSIPHGTGTYVYKNKYFTYNGEWVNGVKHGRGTLTMGDGSRFEGTFVDGEITGQGMRTWPDGSSYTGEFYRGEFCGQGIYRGLNGVTYEGEFLDNKRHGEGELVLENGAVYHGHFDGHRKHGDGTYTDAHGNAFQGTFVFNKLSKGSCNFADGSTYKGDLLNFQRHGCGTSTDAQTGLSYEGEFLEDERQSWPHAICSVVSNESQGEASGSEEAESIVGSSAVATLSLEVKQGEILAPIGIRICERTELQGDAADAARAAAAAASAGGKGKKGGKKKAGTGDEDPVYGYSVHTVETGRRISLTVCAVSANSEGGDEAQPTLLPIAAIDPTCDGAEDIADPVPEKSPSEEPDTDGGDDGGGEQEVVDPLDLLAGARALVVTASNGSATAKDIRVIKETPPGEYILQATDVTPNLANDKRLAPFQWKLVVSAAAE